MKIVSYLRQSSQKQARSGLSIEAQHHAVQDYAQSTSGQVVAEFVETESGGLNARPELI